MKTDLKKLLFYGGLEKEEYKEIMPQIAKSNMEAMFIYAAITGTLFFALSIFGLWPGSEAYKNEYIYLVSTVLSFTACVLAKINLSVAWSTVASHVYQIILYGFALSLIGHHTDNPSVSIVVLIVVIPLLFTGHPIDNIVCTFIIDVVFCFMAVKLKAPEVVDNDIFNGITFGLVGMAVGLFVCRLRVQSLYQIKLIRTLSETDILTGLLNRNSYENSVLLYPEKATESVCCIYGDVNGLHEMNNLHGHRAGDIMLQTIAEAFRNQFGKENTYRIGGDEFVSFALDAKEDNVIAKIKIVDEVCLKNDYHVSWGYKFEPKDDCDMDKLVQAAEQKMYKVKAEYYSQEGRERRH